ncbi:filamentous haemagglutinin family protein [Methylomonas sp. AM2-LC]|uniref:filamentous haemagglutinin family protein n=1 Tax=Methylomonas sp. AM2-LC TaxID=3153301 RepID=UPI003266A736
MHRNQSELPDQTSSQTEKIANKTFCCLFKSGVLIISNATACWAEPAGLPVPVNSLNHLTNPSLHNTVNVSTVGEATASISSDGHTMTIDQTTGMAILDWSSFNIAQGNTVQFVQPTSTSVALNEIGQSDASQIMGHLLANGQVYLVNTNGFLFGSHSVVNTNTLVASSLEISDNVFQQGITNVVTNGAPTTNTGSNSTTTPVAALSGNSNNSVEILVEKGANIKVADKGRVILAAPVVENDGTISAPDGQVILVAAKDKVFLQESSSADLRGLLVEVQTGGSAKNLGTIIAERGNATMMGFAVSQQGVVSASTSVALNGSVRLLAREGAQLVNTSVSNTTNYLLEPASDSTVRSNDLGDGLGKQATVTMSKASNTTVTLDDSAGSAVLGSKQPQSIVDVEAGYIDMQNGSQIVAHDGLVNLTANQSPTTSNSHFGTPPTLTASNNNTSRILLETGSSIDVSGVQNVAMAMSSNILDVSLYSYELRNDPTQKHGLLYGKNVEIDMRQGTSLADISEAEAAIKYSVAYHNSQAGTVNLASEGDVIVQHGANINISGGSIAYQAGEIQTTELVSNGVVYSMATASQNLNYQQLITVNTYQAAYTQGMNAGKVNITSRDVLLDGAIQAKTIAGEYQRNVSSLPSAGQLAIDTSWTGLLQQDVIFTNTQNLTTTPDLASAVTSPLYLSNTLFSQGLSSLNLKTGGDVSITQDTNLTLPALGNLTVQAGSISVEGNISVPAGTVALSTNVSNNPAGAKPDGIISLAKGSVIDSSGVWVNDLLAMYDHQPLQTLPINGGSISLQAQGDLLLEKGAKLNANGGAWLQNNTTLSAGLGGNISLSTAGIGANSNTHLLLGADLSAFGLSEDGHLSIAANSIDIVADPALTSTTSSTLFLSNHFFEKSGFSTYTLTANNGDLSVAANTTLNLQQTNWQLTAAAYNMASGTPLQNLTAPIELSGSQRNPVNLNLNLSQTVEGVNPAASLSIGKNAVINADPLASIRLTSDANINIDGRLNTLGGSIDISITSPANSSSDPGYNANQAILLGADAYLNASGGRLLTPNNRNQLLGTVLDGGTITLAANRGYILMESSSTLDVSGSQGLLNISNAQGLQTENIASAGGSINLTAAEGMALQGQFYAAAGHGQVATNNGVAAGGSLNISLNAQNRGEPLNVSFPTSERIIQLSAKPSVLLSDAQMSSGIIPASINGLANISASQIQTAGFDHLSLDTFINAQSMFAPEPLVGAVQIVGDLNLTVKLSIDLDTPILTHSWTGPADSGQVTVTTDMFTLGSSQNQTTLPGSLTNSTSNAFNGKTPAILTVNADTINLQGASALSGFNQTQLLSSDAISLIGVNPNGQNNLLGSLQLTGELDLGARAIFPTTMTQFSITIDATQSPNGLVKILPSQANRVTPLSAGGELTINAPIIDSYGVMLAPFGTINLAASSALTLEAGSFTSVSDFGIDTAQGKNIAPPVTIPFGKTEGNASYWYYPIGSSQNILSGTPEKAISLNSPNIKLLTGATINLNGGGNLSAYEFIPGPGGSMDYLSASYQHSYAIVPTLNAAYAPYDALATASSGLSLGENIYLSASADGLAAGNYVLLPAIYALLPGAYLITPQASMLDMAAGTTYTSSDGATVVAAYTETAGSNVVASHWQGVEVQSGQVAFDYSPYQVTTASSFFTSHTPSTAVASLPEDAGNLSLLASQTLSIDADIMAKASTGGLGGQLDISANNIDIANSAPATPSANITLTASGLNALGVDSILVGGERKRSSTGTTVTVNAENVNVEANIALKAPEIILAASHSIDVASGASISATGSLNRTDTQLTIVNGSSNNNSGNGALLRVSNAGQASVVRNHAATDPLAGSLTIESGASLSGAGSILLDATGSGSLQGSIQGSTPNTTLDTLTLNGSLITLGGTATANTGFQLADNTLNTLKVANLQLLSASTINIADTINLHLSHLTLDASGLIGTAHDGQIATINADSVVLQNSTNQASSPISAGTQQLNLLANTITLGSGHYALGGFKQINLEANQHANAALKDSGTGSLTSVGDMTITTPVWTALAGANTTMTIENGHLTTLADGSAVNNAALGAKLQLTAEQIDLYGNIAIASGVVNLQAAQDVNLHTGSSIDTSGQVIQLGNDQIGTGGGSISLKSDTGNVTVETGSNLNVSGSILGANAGSVSLNAAMGTINVAGTLQGFAYQGGTGASFNLNAQHMLGNFSKINSLLQEGGFDGDLALRLGEGNLTIGATDKVQAQNISLITDNGLIKVYGTLDVSGAQAGSLQLAANKGILIESGATLKAVSTTTTHADGSIKLSSDPLPVNGINKGIGVVIYNGATLDAGKSSVEVLVNRLNNHDAAVNIANNTVLGSGALNVYVMAHYADLTPTDALFQQWLTDTQHYLNAASTNTDLNTRLAGFNLLPGLDIQTHGNLNWNISTALTNQVSTPGLLSIRATGDINFQKTLSDGFVPGNTALTLQSGPSWSYNIVAGADLSSANNQDTLASSNGSVHIGSETSVRTGTGNIYVAAAGDITLTDFTSTIFTAGESGSIQDPYKAYRPTTFSVQYPVNGGNLTLNAGGNIVGASTPQLMSDWLQRSGSWTANSSTVNRNNLPTAWGIDFGSSVAAITGAYGVNSSLGFMENIGALGGGNVTVHAGANIQDLSVMLPTTAIASLQNGSMTLQENGGGNLLVTAGGNIAGGVFYVEKGTANISANGAITGGTEYSSGPIFALGDTQFNVTAATGLDVGAVLNPFIIAQAGVQSSKTNYFSTYTEQSGINLQSLTGDINLNNNISLIENQISTCSDLACEQTDLVYPYLNAETEIAPLLAMYPGNLHAYALSGNLAINHNLSLYAAANSSFSLEAAANIILGDNVDLTQLDINPTQYLAVLTPLNANNFTLDTAYWLNQNSYENTNAHAAVPVHNSDTQHNKIISAKGSILGTGNSAFIISAKATDISAALDLSNLNLSLQNLNSTYQDVSSLSVGGNISYTATPDPVSGSFTSSKSPGIQIAGPGWLNVWAGGNIDLGISNGITSVGSLYNTALPSLGANITVLAGQPALQISISVDDYLQTYVYNPDYEASLQQQLQTSQSVPLATALQNLIAAINTSKTNLAQAKNSNSSLQAAISVLFSQFNWVDTAVNTSEGTAAYQVGYDAIKLLFPDPGKGNITLNFSEIQTQAGGNINLLAPGGLVNVGLNASDLSISKSADQLGIVAQGQGNVNILTSGDVQVNQSRIFTLDAGNITVWSSEGNIDAGRGAKSSLASEFPIANYDAYGNLILTYPATVSGSGIRAQSGYNSTEIGNISLIAPHGEVNAGEAGIGGNNVIIAALIIGNPGNIQNSGFSLGIPQAPSTVIATDSTGSALAGITKQVSMNLNTEDDTLTKQSAKSEKVAILDTEILGFGQCSVADIRKGVSGCGGDH